MVQLWLPIVALIYLFVTCSVLRIFRCIQAHALLKGSSTDYGMNVCRYGPWADYRVATLDGQRLAVDCEDLAMGELDQGQAQDSEESEVKRRHDVEWIDKKLGMDLKGWWIHYIRIA